MPTDTVKKPLRPEIIAAVDRVFTINVRCDPNAINKNLKYLLENSRIVLPSEVSDFIKKSKP